MFKNLQNIVHLFYNTNGYTDIDLKLNGDWFYHFPILRA